MRYIKLHLYVHAIFVQLLLSADSKCKQGCLLILIQSIYLRTKIFIRDNDIIMQQMKRKYTYKEMGLDIEIIQLCLPPVTEKFANMQYFSFLCPE